MNGVLTQSGVQDDSRVECHAEPAGEASRLDFKHALYLVIETYRRRKQIALRFEFFHALGAEKL
jgi:hypothetical protein